MSILLKPKFIALDSSQLGDWCRDKCSPDANRRKIAAEFEGALYNSNFIPFLSWHHFEELLGIENAAIADSRIRFLTNLPFLAWIKPIREKAGLGGIVDILATEVQTAYEQKTGSAIETRDKTVASLIKFGGGQEAMAPYKAIWRDLQPVIWKRIRNAREHVALTRANVDNVSNVKVFDLLNGEIRTSAALKRRFAMMFEDLARDIAIRGDKRIADANDVASRFLCEAIEMATSFPDTPREFVMHGLKLLDIHENDIGPETTYGEVGELSVFRKRIRIAARAAGIQFDEFPPHLRMDNIPTWLVSRLVSRYRQEQPERLGSELNDEYLATMSMYADLTLVDKRMLETFRSAQKTGNDTLKLLRAIKKAPSYAKIDLSVGK